MRTCHLLNNKNMKTGVGVNRYLLTKTENNIVASCNMATLGLQLLGFVIFKESAPERYAGKIFLQDVNLILERIIWDQKIIKGSAGFCIVPVTNKSKK